MSESLKMPSNHFHQTQSDLSKKQEIEENGSIGFQTFFFIKIK